MQKRLGAMTQAWTPVKAAVQARGGLVTAQHPAAAQAGAAVLARGGNAVDAAVTAALVLSVVEPWLSGLGGGGFLLRATADGAAQALDFNMVSGSEAVPEAYPLAAGQGGDWFDWPAVQGDRNLTGGASVCVPGAVAGFAEALRRFGTLSWAEALASAIAEAEAGLRVDWFTQLCIGIDAPNLLRDASAAVLLLPDGCPPRLPEGVREARLPWPAKAATLRRLAEAGPEDFYRGALAEALAADLAGLGAPVTAADLAAYAPRWLEPLRGGYRGTGILAMPGLSGGPSFLAAMDRLEGALDPGSAPDAAAYAAYAEAIRGAYAERLTKAGHAAAGGDCTSHINAVDDAGTVVSLTNTLLSRFGAKVLAPRTGLLLNNGMMWFDPRPGTPNAIAPRRRPLANMCPLVLTRVGRPWLAMGAAGGRQIFPALVQLASFAIDFGMDPASAAHQPRLDASAPTIRIDRRCPDATAAAVGRRHPVEVVDDTLYPVQFALPGMIRLEDGTATGMVHPNHPWASAVGAA